VADALLLERAALCYERAGLPQDAARCYRDSGAFRRSAKLFMQLGDLREAAADFARSGLIDQAAWILAHDCAEPAAARVYLAAEDVGEPDADNSMPTPAQLRRLVVTARCDLAEGARQDEIVATLVQICADLQRPRRSHDVVLETWCVQLAEALGRDDQVALVFAAAVRGGRSGARQRWQQWSERVFGIPVVLPDDEIRPAV
jgi:hypothetical protein